ncbi:MAG: hypothetical protein EBR09_15300 [Proteobacteria bacterium]|nr:hypothetical protein [Pseudomonadota bacterium]
MNCRILAAFVFLLNGCAQSSADVAEFAHEWGQTRRGQRPAVQRKPCLLISSMRLSEISSRIAAANPAVFEGPLEISKFCIGVNGQLSGADARSNPETLTVEFSAQMLERATTDDQLAAVLSHELAHVALQHQGFGEIPPRAGTDALFLEIQAESKIIQSRIVELAKSKAEPEKIFALNAEFSVLLGKMNRRIDEIYGEENAHLNWIEQEADEAGAEFFVRAGFEKNAFVDILWATGKGEGEDRNACSLLVEAARTVGTAERRPLRGNKNHPTTCWRVFHLIVDEWIKAHSGQVN